MATDIHGIAVVIILPELCRFDGIIVRMQYRDNDQHYKPHIHICCGDHEAAVGLDGEILAGSIPGKKYILLRAWIILHERELYQAWNNAVREKPIGKIEPLK